MIERFGIHHAEKIVPRTKGKWVEFREYEKAIKEARELVLEYSALSWDMEEHNLKTSSEKWLEKYGTK